MYVAKVKSKNVRVAIKCVELELTKEQDEDVENKKNEAGSDISWDDIQKEAAILARMQVGH